MSIEIARTADDKKQGMTLADLKAFIGFKAQMQKIGVKG